MNKIIFPIRFNMRRDAVLDLHAALALLGHEVESTEVDKHRFGRSTADAVRKLQKGSALQPTGFVDEPTAARLNALIKERGALTPGGEGGGTEAARHYTVKGMVRDEAGNGVAGLTVRVLEIRLRKEAELGQGPTAKNGYYEIQYAPPQANRKVREAFQTVVRVEDRRAKVLHRSEPRRPRPVEWIDFMAGGGVFPGHAEFDQRLLALRPALEGAKLTDVVEDEAHQDISFLARETDLKRDEIMELVVAHRLAERTKLAPEIFYAFLRQGLPPSRPDSLLRASDGFQRIDVLVQDLGSSIAALDAEVQKEILQRALALNYVPLSLKGNVDDIVGKLQALKVTEVLERPYLVGKTPLKSLLALTALPQDRYAAFAERFVAHEGGSRAFWKALAADPAFAPEVVAEVRQTIELGSFAKNHLPLVGKLRETVSQDPSKEPRALARLSSEDWKALVRTAGTADAPGYPANIDGQDEEDKIATFAKEVMKRVERAYPTAALAAHVGRWPKELLARQTESLRFIDRNPELDLMRVHVEVYVRDKAEAAWGDIAADHRPVVLAEVKKLQRMLHVAGRPEAATKLLAKGYHSAADIYHTGKQRFVAKMGNPGLTPIESRKIFDRAEQRYAMVLARLGEHNLRIRGIVPAVIPSGELTPKEEEALASLPTLRDLFGSQDFCDCEHCNSVYSPSAYLVDVLRWLHERDAKAAGRTAKDVLFDRRPDLGTVLLNCQNTNTVLPHVDLVCELLEDEVAPPGGPVDRQTTLPAQELRVNPQYVNTDAYDTLRGASWPHTLPFQLWLEETRGFLGLLGIDRWRLMETFQDRHSNPAVPSDVAVAGEALGMSATELGLVTAADEGNQATHWGGANPVVALATVSEFLDRARLTYDELLELLLVDWVQGTGTPMTIERTTDDCDTSAQTLKNLSDQRLDRIHRFLRLWRRTGLRMWEVDRLLRSPAVGGGNLDGAALVQLRHFLMLQKRLNLSVEELLGFYAPLDTAVRDLPSGKEEGLYLRLFLNRAVLNPVPEDFAVAKVRAAAPAAIKPEHVPSILAALTVTEEDVTRYVPLTDIPALQNELRITDTGVLDYATWTSLADSQAAGTNLTTSGPLSLDTLSLLYRYATLARAAKFSAAELIAFVARAAIPDPFASISETERFLGEVDALRELRLRVDEVDYILGFHPESAAGLREETVTQDLRRLREDRRKIFEEYFASSEPLLANLGRRLAAVPALAGAPAQQAALQIVAGEWTGTAAACDQFIVDHFSSFVDVAAAKARLSAALPVVPDAREAAVLDRAGYVLTALYTNAAARATSQFIATVLRLDDAQARALLDALKLPGGYDSLLSVLADPRLVERASGSNEYTHSLDAATFPALYEAFHLLHKVALLLRALKADPTETNWLIEHGPAVGTPALADLPVEPAQAVVAWATLRTAQRLLAFKRGYREPEGASFVAMLHKVLTAAAIATTLDELATLTGWERTALDTLHASLALQYPADYVLPETYERLAECFAMLRRAGVKADRLVDWARNEPDEGTAPRVREAVKAKYDEKQWLDVAAQVQNGVPGVTEGVREKKRRALVDYLAVRPKTRADGSKTWTDPNGLFAHFLIDVEMTPCQVTTRILQANAAAQLFVQRCLMNLESYISADEMIDERWGHWKWMRRYRVWENNRKVFLYPENWLWPEHRRDKSPFFKELEDDIAQGEITDANVEAAFLSYLEKLHDVANLHVLGVCHEIKSERLILHVIARTKGSAPTYYYRRWVDGAWTSWEKVPLDIKAEQVLPIVFNRRLHLFWPVFTGMPEEEQSIPPAQATNKPSPTPKKYWEIQLGWSTYRSRRWAPIQISERKLIHPWFRPQYAFHLKAQPRDSDLVVRVFLSTSPEFDDRQVVDSNGVEHYQSTRRHDPTSPPWHSSEFVFNGDVKGVYLRDLNGSLKEVREGNYGLDGRATEPLATPMSRLLLPVGEYFEHSYLANNRSAANPDGKSGKLRVLKESNLRVTDTKLLDKALIPFRIVTPHQDPQFLSVRPFFFQDSERAWFIEPTLYYRKGSTFSPEIPASPSGVEYKVQYRFYPFYHPWTRLFIRQLATGGVNSLFRRDVQVKPEQVDGIPAFAFSSYAPAAFVSATPEKEVVEFGRGAPYGPYNWELFFHAPLLVASRLSGNQRHEDAIRWYHYIFNPTNPVAEAGKQRYWITKPFYAATEPEMLDRRIEDVLKKVNQRLPAYELQVQAWRDNPFDPHIVASMRWVAYQKCVVMAYLDNLIAWGDRLFREDRRESINEATQLYVLAADILGSRPRRVPALGRTDRSYEDLEADLDKFGNALVEVENTLPQITIGTPSELGSEPLPRLETFYFGIPANEKLLKYWNDVWQRLWNIRHCRNIEGAERPLALWDPPIDPGLLVKAAAAGVDPSSVLQDQGAPLPHYRFEAVLRRARDMAAEVRALGAALLAALEKRDAEALALMRAQHEASLLDAAVAVRTKQEDEANEQLKALRQARRLVERRRDYYRSRQYMSASEKAAASLEAASISEQDGALMADILASQLSLIPEFTVGASGAGGSPHAVIAVGGKLLGKAAELVAKARYGTASYLSKVGALAATLGGYERRADEWKFQGDQAEQEVNQVDRQIAAADIRHAIAKLEKANQELQVRLAGEVEEHLRQKFTNKELYDWMVSQLATIYFQSYQLAFDLAKRAEHCFRYELGVKDTTFIQFGYWDSLKKGLLSGERLTHDLQRIEAAYLEQNRRHFELTKNVSLALVAPLDLALLRETGECFVDLPEVLFDLDHPGHYLRRIKSVSMSIPAVTGPYGGVHCTLTLLENRVRTSNLVGDGYPRKPRGTPDPRFEDNIAGVQSIATSHGREDSGLFQLDFRDERYLPFEGAGADSRWRIALPRDTNDFNPRSIADVILHIRYTALDGGDLLRSEANKAVVEVLPRKGIRVFSARSDFPDAWNRFLRPANVGDVQELQLSLTTDLFPFFARGRNVTVQRVEFLAAWYQAGDLVAQLAPPLAANNTIPVTRDGKHGQMHYGTKALGSEAIGDWILRLRAAAAGGFTSLPPDSLSDLFVVLHFEMG